MNLATNNGSILFEGNNPDAVEMIHVTSQNGDVNLTTTGTATLPTTTGSLTATRAMYKPLPATFPSTTAAAAM